jgi:hypothetical protein
MKRLRFNHKPHIAQTLPIRISRRGVIAKKV